MARRVIKGKRRWQRCTDYNSDMEEGCTSDSNEDSEDEEHVSKRVKTNNDDSGNLVDLVLLLPDEIQTVLFTSGWLFPRELSRLGATCKRAFVRIYKHWIMQVIRLSTHQMQPEIECGQDLSGMTHIQIVSFPEGETIEQHRPKQTMSFSPYMVEHGVWHQTYNITQRFHYGRCVELRTRPRLGLAEESARDGYYEFGKQVFMCGTLNWHRSDQDTHNRCDRSCHDSGDGKVDIRGTSLAPILYAQSSSPRKNAYKPCSPVDTSIEIYRGYTAEYPQEDARCDICRKNWIFYNDDRGPGCSTLMCDRAARDKRPEVYTWCHEDRYAQGNADVTEIKYGFHAATQRANVRMSVDMFDASYSSCLQYLDWIKLVPVFAYEKDRCTYAGYKDLSELPPWIPLNIEHSVQNYRQFYHGTIINRVPLDMINMKTNAFPLNMDGV